MKDLRQPIRGTRNEAAGARYLHGNEQMRRAALEGAKALREIQACEHFAAVGYGSIAEFGEGNGVSAADTMRQLALARLLQARPEFEERILAGVLFLHAASLLGELPQGELRDHGDAWLALAVAEPAKQLRRKVEKFLEDERIGEATSVALTSFVSPRGRDDFARAKTLASKKAERRLTRGEAFEAISSHYLDSFDPLREKEGTRRLPDTEGIPGRSVPASVRPAVIGRRWGRCQVPFCPYEGFLELAHVVPHSHGGCRERRCLLWLCTRHHAMFDRGLLLLRGSAESPTFLTPSGRDLSLRVPSSPSSSSSGLIRPAPT
jgi:hypothetical protein